MMFFVPQFLDEDGQVGDWPNESCLLLKVSSNIEQTLRNYYSWIDAREFDKVMGLFAEDAVYNRAGEVYSSKPEIDEFFHHLRKLDGVHSIEGIFVNGLNAFVVGEFKGVGDSNNPKQTGFIDHWQFNTDCLVVERKTALVEGSAYVLR